MKKTIYIYILLSSLNLQAEFLHKVIPFRQKKYKNYGVYSKLQERVLNRKQVSYILTDTGQNYYRLVLLVHHPMPWSYKAAAHPLYFKFSNAEKMMELAKYLDAYLEGGYNFKIKLKGSRIISLYFFKTKLKWKLEP